MNDEDDTPVQYSATERQVRRLVVPEPAAYAHDKRLDLMRQPDLDLLWGAHEEYPAIGGRRRRRQAQPAPTGGRS